MAIKTINGAERYFGVTIATSQVPGFPYLEIGPAGTAQQSSTMMIQFNSNDAFTGNFVVLGKMLGTVAQERAMPFVPIPYRVGSLNDVAQVDANGNGWPWSIAPIAGPAIIRVPSGGLSVILLIGLDTGQMDICSWGLQGNSVV